MPSALTACPHGPHPRRLNVPVDLAAIKPADSQVLAVPARVVRRKVASVDAAVIRTMCVTEQCKVEDTQQVN